MNRDEGQNPDCPRGARPLDPLYDDLTPDEVAEAKRPTRAEIEQRQEEEREQYRKQERLRIEALTLEERAAELAAIEAEKREFEIREGLRLPMALSLSKGRRALGRCS